MLQYTHEEILPVYPRALWEYYRDKFGKIADKIGEQINYNYEEKKAKCERKAMKKEKADDIGGNALTMAMSRRRK